MTDRLHVRLATSDAELHRIYALRYDVYIEEMGKAYPTVDHSQRELSDPADRTSKHLYATDDDGKVIAATRMYYGRPSSVDIDIFGDPSHPISADRPFHYVSRFVIAHRTRDLRIASSLAKAAYAYARARGVIHSYIHCNPRLILLWTRFGYEAYRPFIDDQVVGCQVPMLLRTADQQRLAEVKSPFLHLAEACRLGAEHWNAAMKEAFTDPPLLASVTHPQERPETGAEGRQ